MLGRKWDIFFFVLNVAESILLYATGHDKIRSSVPFPFLICAKLGGCYIILNAEQTYLSLVELG